MPLSSPEGDAALIYFISRVMPREAAAAIVSRYFEGLQRSTSQVMLKVKSLNRKFKYKEREIWILERVDNAIKDILGGEIPYVQFMDGMKNLINKFSQEDWNEMTASQSTLHAAPSVS